MSSIPQVSELMQMILTTRAKVLERKTGFVHRSTVQLDGPVFAQTTVLTWMQNPDADYTQLRHTAARMAGVGEQSGDRATRKSGVSRAAASLVRGSSGTGDQQ